MNVSELLNPITSLTLQQQQPNHKPRSRCVSTPLLSRNNNGYQSRYSQHSNHSNHSQYNQHDQHSQNGEDNANGKPRSRFSEYEDDIIRRGVAQKLTWGQISDLLPHRKRATCFNRYRTLQGIRKSRKSMTPESVSPSVAMSRSPSAESSPSSYSSSFFTPSQYTNNNSQWYSASDVIYNSGESSESDDELPTFGAAANNLPSIHSNNNYSKKSHRISLPALSRSPRANSMVEPYYNL